jgi:hypothetical protein
VRLPWQLVHERLAAGANDVGHARGPVAHETRSELQTSEAAKINRVMILLRRMGNYPRRITISRERRSARIAQSSASLAEQRKISG